MSALRTQAAIKKLEASPAYRIVLEPDFDLVRPLAFVEVRRCYRQTVGYDPENEQ